MNLPINDEDDPTCPHCRSVLGHYQNCPVLAEEARANRKAVVAQMRAKYIAQRPDPQVRKAMMLNEFRHDMSTDKPWLPGAVFISNPGLDAYLLECLERWDPEPEPPPMCGITDAPE